MVVALLVLEQVVCSFRHMKIGSLGGIEWKERCMIQIGYSMAFPVGSRGVVSLVVEEFVGLSYTFELRGSMFVRVPLNKRRHRHLNM